MKEKIIALMKCYFGQDEKRIKHAKAVLSEAETLMQGKKSLDCDVVCAAAILHDIGIHEAEKKHGSTAGKYQEIEGPPIAKDILKEADFPDEKLDEVLTMIAHHHSGGIDSTNFNILLEADRIVNQKEKGQD